MTRYLFLLCSVAAILTPSLVRAQANTSKTADVDTELVETRRDIPKLKAAAAYVPQNNTIVVELSNYAGYSGLVVANGGLEPNPESIFFKQFGFQVKLTMSEAESWGPLNAGEMAASATTADVLAAYGGQFRVVIPALIGFSRGADGIVVRSEIKKINDLKGKTLSVCQFTESDFLIRYLAQEAGLEVNLLDDLSSKPNPSKLNLVACSDGFGAGDIFLRDLKAGRNRLAGCVTWAPKTTEVSDGSSGRAHTLTTNTNLLIVADILVVNKGFADAHPEMVAGLVKGLILGNDLVRSNPKAHLALLEKVFKWDPADAEAELAKVHLANLPENTAFFNGTIDSAGSYGFIYESTVSAYGKNFIANPVDGDSFLNLKALKDLEKAGTYKDQKAEIVPIKTASAPVEDSPLLSKNIRFLFEPNVAKLDMNSKDNLANLQNIATTLNISPGSTILLRGHADNQQIEKFHRAGGDAMVRAEALVAMQLSKERAEEIARILTGKYGVDTNRVRTVGRGWEEPIGTTPAENRRVEMQWFTVE